MGGRLVLPLNRPWNVSDDVPAEIFHGDQYYKKLSFSCYQVKSEAIWATKDEFIFSSGFRTKTALSDTHTEAVMN